MSTTGPFCSVRHMPDDVGGAVHKDNGSKYTLECNTKCIHMYVSTAASKFCNGK